MAQELFLTNLVTLVPQTEQVPLMAGRPFLSTTSLGFVICRFALHLTQYASICSHSPFSCVFLDGGFHTVGRRPNPSSRFMDTLGSLTPRRRHQHHQLLNRLWLGYVANYAKPQGRCPA